MVEEKGREFQDNCHADFVTIFVTEIRIGSALIAAYYTLLATFGFVQLQPFMHALALAGKASRTHRSVSQQLYGGVFYFYSLQDAPGFAIV